MRKCLTIFWCSLLYCARKIFKTDLNFARRIAQIITDLCIKIKCILKTWRSFSLKTWNQLKVFHQKTLYILTTKRETFWCSLFSANILYRKCLQLAKNLRENKGKADLFQTLSDWCRTKFSLKIILVASSLFHYRSATESLKNHKTCNLNHLMDKKKIAKLCLEWNKNWKSSLVSGFKTSSVIFFAI